MLAGDELAGTIHEQLEAADIIILLVSARFIASHYCYDIETARAMERHHESSARVLPAIVRPCAWNNLPLGSLKLLPQDGKPISQFSNRDEAYVQIVDEIRRAATRPPGSRASSQSPEARQAATLTRSSPRIRKSFSGNGSPGPISRDGS
jgi:hypothetical protein